MDSAHVRDMINVSQEMISLDAELNSTEDGHNQLLDFQEDTNYKKPEEQAIENSLSSEINTVLKTLSPKEAKVIKLRYGLNGAKPMSLKEVGDRCNLTKERIRQIEKHAIIRLQSPSRSDRLSCYVA